jgi:hypothetical protein
MDDDYDNTFVDVEIQVDKIISNNCRLLLTFLRSVDSVTVYAPTHQ